MIVQDLPYDVLFIRYIWYDLMQCINAILAVHFIFQTKISSR